MKLRHLTALSLLLVLMLVPACSKNTTPVNTESPYIGSCDVSKPSFSYIEFILPLDWVLEGKVFVDVGCVVFIVTDSLNYDVEDKIVNAGESYSFSITAKQSAERYRCYFGFLPGEENAPRKARFDFNTPPEGWEKVE
jgi:hypothetical protein